MHEHSLFASIPASQHNDLLQQLAGVTAMQPNHIYERHLIFKPYRKPGFIRPRPGGSQDVQAQEAQRLNKLLSGSLYYIKVVGEVTAADFGGSSAGDVAMGGTAGTDATAGDQTRHQYDISNQSWRLEFKDIPDAGTGSAVTSRLISSSKIPYGDIVPIMKTWGYDYVSEYVLESDTFILDDTLINLHRILNFPTNSHHHHQGAPAQRLPALAAMAPLDTSGNYILQASVTVQDSGNPDLMKAASQRLLGLKEHLKTAVKLEPADRLSLDTRVK